jgi:hypothetical protein
VAADAQLGQWVRQLCCFAKGCAVGHQRGRGYDPVCVSFDDGPVYAGGESEIVRIDDQAPHDCQSSRRRTAVVYLVSSEGHGFRSCR